MKKTLNAFVMMLALGLSGCGYVIGNSVPAVDVGQGWDNGAAVSGTAAALPAQWWVLFGSDDLNALEKRAMARNLTVAQALEEVTQARAQLTIARAGQLPSLSASANASTGLNDGSGAILSSVGVDLAYQVDLWGGNRAAKVAARDALDAATFGAEATRLTVQGTVATSYISLLSLRERVALAQESVAMVSDTLGLLQQQYDAGAISAIELAQQQTLLAQTRASLANLQNQQAAAKTALAVLLGYVPSAMPAVDGKLAMLAVPEIAADTPAAVLRRRPDVRQAEANLRAADADVAVAQANLFPQLNLSLSALEKIDPSSFAVTAGAGLLQPIFEGGSLRARVLISESQRRALVAAYTDSVLTALKEVEDALSGARAAGVQVEQQNAARAAAEQSFRLSRQKFEAGALDMPTLLDSERSLISARDSLLSAMASELNASVQVILALGG